MLMGMNKHERSGWGPIVEARRRELGLTQNEVGDRAGMSGRSVRNVETAAVVPQEKQLRALLGVLELSIDKDIARRQVKAGMSDDRPFSGRELDTARELWLRMLASEHRDDTTGLIDTFRRIVTALPEDVQWGIFNGTLDEVRRPVGDVG